MDVDEFIYIASDEQRINNYLSGITDVNEYTKYRDLIINNRELVSKFLRYAINKLKDVNIGDVQIGIDADAKQIQNESVSGIENIDIKYTLNELYRQFHIDQDVIESIDVKLEKLSDIANRLVSISSNRIGFDKKTGKDTSVLENIYKLQDDARNARYASCCYDTLRYIHTAILEYKAFIEKNDLKPEDKNLAHINKLAKQLIKITGVINDYKDIIAVMMDT